jgi:hypothetical protein
MTSSRMMFDCQSALCAHDASKFDNATLPTISAGHLRNEDFEILIPKHAHAPRGHGTLVISSFHAYLSKVPRVENDDVIYSFRTLDQSVAYRLTSSDIIVTHRKGLTRTVQTIPVKVFRVRQCAWETTNQSWIILAIVSALTIAFGIWGLIDPKSTGMYTAVAVGLIAIGLVLPCVSWNHRKLTGVTFSGDSDFSLSIIAHAIPTQQFLKLVSSLEAQIQGEPK